MKRIITISVFAFLSVCLYSQIAECAIMMPEGVTAQHVLIENKIHDPFAEIEIEVVTQDADLGDAFQHLKCLDSLDGMIGMDFNYSLKKDYEFEKDAPVSKRAYNVKTLTFFDNLPSASYLGTDSNLIPKDQWTINLNRWEDGCKLAHHEGFHCLCARQHEHDHYLRNFDLDTNWIYKVYMPSAGLTRGVTNAIWMNHLRRSGYIYSDSVDYKSIMFYPFPKEGFKSGIGYGINNKEMSKGDLETWSLVSPRAQIFQEYPYLEDVEGCVYEEMLQGVHKMILVDDEALYFDGVFYGKREKGFMRSFYKLQDYKESLKYDCNASSNDNIIYIHGINQDRTEHLVKILNEFGYPYDIGN